MELQLEIPFELAQREWIEEWFSIWVGNILDLYNLTPRFQYLQCKETHGVVAVNSFSLCI